MADDGFEQFHVPQQSRRDKLRVVAAAAQSHNQQHQSNCQDVVTALPLHGCTGLLPLYDPSLLSPDILTCSNTLATLKQQNPVCVKEEGNGNFMSFVSGYMTMNTTSASSSSSSHYHHQQHHHHPYLDPLSTSSNPSSIQDITNNNNSSNNNNNPFLYTVQNLRDYEQSFHGGGGGDVVRFKPQGLAITDESRTTRTSTGQGLSLSLSSHHTHHQNHNHNLPLELNLPSSLGYGVRGIIDGGGASTSNNNDVRNSVPLGPFTGYASILKGSKFLKPAKQLLDELCDVGRGIYVDRPSGDSSSLMDPSMDSLTVDDHVMSNDHGGGGEHRRKKSRLISMLDEVYRRYKLYYQQMQAIVASFESVAGLGDAAPYTSFALKAMSKHFSCLKNAITDQLHFTNKAIVEGSHSKDESQRFGNADRWSHGQRPPAHHLTYFEHHNQPVWRPQRGLPERAVAVLRAWLFEHFLHPYPTDADKQMLAKQTGLSRSQVSNWFINARVRLWKPMVEEIHMLETRQTQKTCDVEDRNSSKSDDPLPTSNQPNSDKQPQMSSTLNIQDQTSKRSRVEVVHVPEKATEPGNFMYNNFSSHRHVQGGVGSSGGNGGVSLTLGLRQNNGIGLSESFPMNIAQQYGLQASNEGYVIGSFETPNRHFGKDIGGQLFHDFVG